MTPIRPAGLPAPPTAHPSAEAQRLAAQRAFFDQALGRAAPAAKPAAAAAPQAPRAPAPAPQMISRMQVPARAEETTAKPLRPGSLLDIRV